MHILGISNQCVRFFNYRKCRLKIATEAVQSVVQFFFLLKYLTLFRIISVTSLRQKGLAIDFRSYTNTAMIPDGVFLVNYLRFFILGYLVQFLLMLLHKHFRIFRYCHVRLAE